MAGITGQSEQRGDLREQPVSIIWLFGQIVMIPLAAFMYGFELFAETLQEANRTASRGLNMVVGDRQGVTDCNASPANAEPPPVTNNLPGEFPGEDARTNKENINMSYDGGIRRDRDLQDDMLKLVRYKILFVRRDFEHAFQEREDLVYDSMDGSAFAAWKVAEFIQELHKGHTPVPEKWTKRNYPKPEYLSPDGTKLIGLDDEDKKYLRVYYEVLERYVREKFYYEEQQIEILNKIADRMGEPKKSMNPAGAKPGSSSSAAPSPGTGSTSPAGAPGSATTYVTPGTPGGGAAGPGPGPGRTE